MSLAVPTGTSLRLDLFGQLLSMEARKQMSYRVDFWLNAFAAFAAELAVAYFLWQAIFAGSGREVIGGYTFDAMVVYYVVVLLVGRLSRGRERDLHVAQDIYEGTLTRYLLYPASWVVFKFAEQLGSLLPSLIQVVLLLGGFALVSDLPLGITWATVALTVPSVLLAGLLWFLLRMPVQLTAFWADNVWSLNVLLRFIAEILGGMMLPLSVFPSAFQGLLHWLPFRFFFSFPTRTLLGEIGLREWLAGMALLGAWCLVFGAAAAIVWNRGQKTYTGVGI